MQTIFLFPYLSAVRLTCQTKRWGILIAVCLLNSWACHVHAEETRLAIQGEIAAFKEAQQTKLDALRGLQQKDLEVWKTKAEALDKRVDDLNNLTTWCGILVTVLLVFISFVTYRNAKSDAKSEARAAAVDFLSEKLAFVDNSIKESMSNQRNAETLSKEMLVLAEQTLLKFRHFKLSIMLVSGDVMLTQGLIYWKQKQRESANIFLQKALEFFNFSIDGTDVMEGTALGNRAYVHWLLGDVASAKDDYIRGLRSENNGGQKLYESTLERLKKNDIPEKDEGMLQLVEELWLLYTTEQSRL